MNVVEESTPDQEPPQVSDVSFILLQNKKLLEKVVFLSAKVAQLEERLQHVPTVSGQMVGISFADQKKKDEAAAKKKKSAINPLLQWIVGISKNMASRGRLFKYQVDDVGTQVKGTWKWISPSVKLEDIADHCCGKKERNGKHLAWSCWKLKEDSSIVNGSYEEIELAPPEENVEEVMKED